MAGTFLLADPPDGGRERDVRALSFVAPGRIDLAEVADPAVESPTDAVVRIERAGLCGSDLHPYRGSEVCAPGVVCGHEGVGTVTAVGADVVGVAPGDRVLIPFTTSCGACWACLDGLTARCVRGRLLGWAHPDRPEDGLDGCQAEAVRVPLATSTLVRLPPGLDDDTGVLLADNLPTAWHAVARADVPPGGRLAVVGLGAVGLCAVVSGLAAGAAEVVALDPVPERRAAAAALGATVLDPAALPLDLIAVDGVVEAAGPPAAQALAARLVREGGTVSIVAVQTAPTFGIDPVTAYDRNLTIRCGRAPVRAVLDTLLPMVLDGTLVPPTTTVVTHAGRALSEGPSLYAQAADAGGGLLKATFAP